MQDIEDSKLLHLMYGEFRAFRKELNEVKDILNKHTQILEKYAVILNEHSEILTTHTVSLLNIENTLKFYGDMYQVNRDEIKNLDKRVNKLEKY
ncbi:MAG TPA: hypothetical protein VLI92_00915 [Candidatus Saccharimonadales bacterium]|nr:hypothetical protein [Candidatus Saccharimonadales bacterium]